MRRLSREVGCGDETELIIIHEAKALLGAYLTEERVSGPMELVLTDANQKLVREGAEERYGRSRARGYKQNYGIDESSYRLEDELDSMGGEAAAAQTLGVPWKPSLVPDRDGDIGPGWQVRHTRYVAGRLRVHPPDGDDHRFILVTGEFPFYVVVGWQYGEVVKRLGAWKELQRGRPAFWLEQHLLRDMGEW